jgi:hypothetical protein
MAQTIKLKRSATSGAVPTTSALALGEMAINTHDGKVYIKKDDGAESVIQVGDTSNYLPLSGGTLTGDLDVTGTVNTRPLFLNRLSSDGDIAEFSKDGTTVGSIGVALSDNLYFSGVDAGIGCGTGAIYPATTTGQPSANDTDLGTSSTRFRNLHLSGSAYVATSVGIGTTSPIAPLDVESGTGNVGFNYGTLSSPERGNLWYDTDGTGWQFKIGKVQAGSFTSQITIQDNGNVGIGTASPSNTLHVAGTMRYDGRLLTDSTASDGSAAAPSIVVGYDYNTGFFRPGTDTIGFATGGAERMRLASTGRLGIGTTSPTSGLHVVGNVTSGETTGYFTGAAGRNNYVRIGADSNRRKSLVFQSGGTDRFSMGVGDSDELSETSFFIGAGVSGGAGADLTITSSGAVGIGTPTPSKELVVNQNSSECVALIKSSDTGVAGIYLGGQTDEIKGGLLFNNSDNSLQLRGYNNAERARINASGHLLHGTTTTTPTAGGTSLLAGTASLLTQSHAAGTSPFGSFQQYKYNSSVIGSVSRNGNTGVFFVTTSDGRLKENVRDSDDAGSKIDAIQVRQYDWKADGSHQDYGMIAQELIEVAPEAVSGQIDTEDTMGIDYSKLVPMLIKEIQSLRNRVAQLEE